MDEQCSGGGVTSTHNKRGCVILTKKSSTQKSGNLPKIETQKSGNLPKIETQKSGNLPNIETQKAGNPKRQAFLLHEKTYHPNQKVFDINFMFQFYLLFYVCAESFKFSSTTISLSCDICSVSKINIILLLWLTFIRLGSSQMNNVT